MLSLRFEPTIETRRDLRDVYPSVRPSVCLIFYRISGLHKLFDRRAISDFRCGVNKIVAGLVCWVALINSYLPTFHDNLSVPTSRVSYSLFWLTLEDGIDWFSRNVST